MNNSNHYSSVPKNRLVQSVREGCTLAPSRREITNDFGTSARFYEDKLGLELWLDQGSCRIYHVSGSEYVGLCQAERSSAPPTGKQPGVIA